MPNDAPDPFKYMTAQSSFEVLTELLPPRPGSGLAVDWSAVEEAWELKFPSDYKNLIAHYGEIVLGDYLSVMAPDTVTPDT
ncbi:hypothetical protein AB0G87_38865 [Streptomyces asoensis]|uniref:hypothetical protein n=1 Tax=Streptomyces asoensis TaxID=249586 RepID=UPI00340D2295